MSDLLFSTVLVNYVCVCVCPCVCKAPRTGVDLRHTIFFILKIDYGFLWGSFFDVLKRMARGQYT